MMSTEIVIEQTKKWIEAVVIGCNFCPFASQVVKRNAVHFEVEAATAMATCLESFAIQLHRLDNDETVETIFLIYPNAVPVFEDYLDLLALAENWMHQQGYEGIYQLASFHPLYLFAKSTVQDPANYTNRSIYPMLHLLRESSIDKALEHYQHPENIPGNNINFARNKGLEYMKLLRDACFAVI